MFLGDKKRHLSGVCIIRIVTSTTGLYFCYLDMDLTIGKYGLIASFVGTIFVAVSVGKLKSGETGPQPSYVSDHKGNKMYVTHLNHPRIFKVGLFLIAFGFVLQFFDI